MEEFYLDVTYKHLINIKMLASDEKITENQVFLKCLFNAINQ